MTIVHKPLLEFFTFADGHLRAVSHLLHYHHIHLRLENMALVVGTWEEGF